MLGSGAVVVMDSSTCMVRAAWRITKFFSRESCGQCTPCREGSGWLERILHRIEHGERPRGGPRPAARRVRQHLPGLAAGRPQQTTICVLGPVDPLLDHLGHRDVPGRVPGAHQGRGLPLWLSRRSRPRRRCSPRRRGRSFTLDGRPATPTGRAADRRGRAGRDLHPAVLLPPADEAGGHVPDVPGRGERARGAPRSSRPASSPVTEGMEVVTDSDKVKKAQDGVLEFLLVNHPLDCPVCDKGGECPLQDQTLAYGPGREPVRRGEAALREAHRHLRAGPARPGALHPVRPLHPLRRGGGRRGPDRLRRPGRAGGGGHLPRRAVLLVLQRQHRPDLPGGRADRHPLPLHGPALGPRPGRVDLHHLRPRLPGGRAVLGQPADPAARHRHATRSTRAGCATRAASPSRRSTATRWTPGRCRRPPPARCRRRPGHRGPGRPLGPTAASSRARCRRPAGSRRPAHRAPGAQGRRAGRRRRGARPWPRRPTASRRPGRPGARARWPCSAGPGCTNEGAYAWAKLAKGGHRHRLGRRPAG